MTLARTGFRKPSLEEVKKKQAAKRLKLLSSPRKARKPRVAPKKRTARQIRRKKGIWATTTADSYFSKWIRERDGKCLRCHRTDQLTNSHYHKRGISATRYCPLNCISLCGECHALWEGPKLEYTELMIARLGIDGFIELQKKAGRTMKRSDAVAECKLLLTKI